MIHPLHPALAPGGLAVVTGAAGGIGLSAARRLQSLGLRLVLVDVDEDRLAQAAAGLEPTGVATTAVDVSDAEAMTAFARTTVDREGPVSVLMNNAGIGGGGSTLVNPAGWARVLGVNLHGVINGVQSFVPEMAASSRPGLVINTGSKQGISQPPGDTAYNVSKAGVKALTEGLAHTLRETTQGRVSAHLLIPGFTYTAMVARRFPDAPPAAWTADQVVDRLFEGLSRDEFYIVCQDNETTWEMDEKRMRWSAEDVIAGRSALSRWHPDWKARFEAFMAQ